MRFSALQTVLLLLPLAAPASASSQRRQQQSNDTTGGGRYLADIQSAISAATQDIWSISQEIHANPELGYQEVRAHKLLTDYLAGRDGWRVTRAAYGVATAFVAEFGSGAGGTGTGTGPVVSFNAEYDALSGLGHACGHNLIAASSLAAALATADVVRAHRLPGRVVLLGTPAEEGGGGKIKLLEAGAYRDLAVDVSIMAHPVGGGDAGDGAYSILQASDRFTIEFGGKPAHSAAAPWQGVSAQDAASLAWTAVGLARAQMRPTDRVHGRFATDAGAVNIVPDRATALWQARAASASELADVVAKLENAVKAGALGTGASFNMTKNWGGYSAMINNDPLAAAYKRNFEALGGKTPDAGVEKSRSASASSDQGNVSEELPAIHPVFGIFDEDGSPTASAPHTAAFKGAAGTRKSFDKAMKAAAAMAGVAVDVLTVDGLLAQVKEDFKKQTGGSSGVQQLKQLRRRYVETQP
ncbi:hypothetical protein GGTG_07505 [Gaeumannomyces tritici R3-111a-1]|uniref:Peptidase M20 dimerisation domain-containing protein n=1 Tax=Gaeumannomyces tritici (strain R3-111a-1) TaxID=644352 RepID=J3P1V7_GAET3|nr:hypothetical protein GGTG_07505 [Gaeumannomyces tritici R3-111a-1]EJT73649.1 hypothetical protein GGTG_07505 [Gaeumannomyces tritici R3-111a-1]